MSMTVDQFLTTLEDYDFLEILDRVGITEFKEKNLCPFHSEKTPSMMIRKKFFICWGCGTKGSVIKFLQEIRGLSFMETVELISNALGMQVKFGRYKEAKDYDELYQKSLEFMDQEIQRGNQAMIELKKKLPPAGYFSPDFDWQDQFPMSNRAVLPVRTASGKVVGFTGRALSDKQMPKWLHSANMPVNYYLSRSKLKKLILVEGPGDAEAILKFIDQGSDWTPVSALGAHVSLEHIKLMKDRETIIMFDGDIAGEKGVLQILQHNVEWRSIFIAQLPDGEDPGSINKELFEESVNKAIPLLDYVLERAEKLLNTPGAIEFNQELVIREFGRRNGNLSTAELRYKFPLFFRNYGTDNKTLSSLLRDHNLGTQEVSVASRDIAYPLRLIATLSETQRSIPPIITIGEVEYRMFSDDGTPKIAPLMDQTSESAEAILSGMYPDIYSSLSFG